MYNSRDDRCLSFGTSSGMFRSNPPEGFYISSLMAQNVNLSMYASMNPNVDSSEQNLIIGQNFGVTRQYGKRKRDDSIIGGSAKSSTCNNYFSQPNANNNNVNTTKSTLSNTYNNGCSFARSYSAASNVRNTQATTGNLSIKQEFPPPIKYETLTKLRSKTPNEILAEMLDSNFQLQRFLNDNRMRTMYDWINSMTILLEKITQCIESRERIVMIFRQISKSQYLEGVYHEIRKPDLITNQLRFTFIQLFLKVSNTFLTMIPHSAGSLMKIFERIELLLTKVEIKSLEYEETKTVLDEVLERLKEIENRRQPKKQKVNHNMGNNDNTPPLDDYRQLNIVPDIKEILSETTTYLRKNIIDGVYDNPHQYLDIHFRLLREDFLGPLHDGIDQYIHNVEGKNFNVRIYENVRSLGPRLNPRSGIVYDLYLDPKSASKIYWANSRRLMFGNLLVLTYNRFHSCIFATVEDRSNIEKNFIISVKPLENINRAQQIQIHLDDIDLSHVLTMIETTTYFEAYRPVLKALQSIDINQPFPFEPFLLKLTNANISPDYIRPETIYDFTPLLVDPDSHVDSTLIKPNLVSRLGRSRQDLLVQPMNNEFRITYKQSNQVPVKYKSVSLLDTNQWPTSDELHLNPKQREALILALTQKVALIQGPPGTGKTYLGVRIVEMLLYNRSVWCQSGLQSTPILMICHTNHALDQFLELIIKRLNINDGVIRVGGRSQNPIIQKFSLLDARRRVRENRLIPSHIYHQKHTILCKKTKAQEELKIHENEIEQSRTTIMPLSSLMDRYIIANEHLSSLLAPYYNRDKETILSDWLNIDPEYNSMAKSQINLMECAAPMPNMNEYEQERTTNNCQAPIDEENINEEEEEEQRRRGEIDIDDDEFMVYTKSKSESTKVKMSTINNNNDIDERQWYHAQRKPDSDRRSIKYIMQNPTTLNDQTVKRIRSDLWKLPMNERYDLYRYWLLKYQQCIFDWDRDKRRLYHQATAELAEEYQEEDYYILKDSVIVAMTTTCAAKCHAVLKKLQSKIVIVEEAAAIFEAHIITALSSKCEHLILIGDHIQLRPSASVYHLATRYNIDVSLFERLIKNKFPNVRLNIQHRMHSEIASLMKHFYDDLEDHISVKENRPSVRGVDSNIFFINHSHPETTVADGSSKRNEFEANYVIELAQYLRKQGYPAEKITILVMYLGQRQFIAKKAKSINLLRGVHITVTDNYQGEENDIIILSLVRSNTDNKIGFLKTHNRICVALSRARCGLFVIGNMNLLVQVEDLWKKIVQSLIDTNKIGTGLPLTCSQHPTHKLIANTPESFLNRAEGGCNKPCDSRLKCGHQCDLMCHNYDTEHRNIICHKKCQESLPCGHACTKQCHVATTNQHNSCRILVNKTIASCGHNIHFECARTPTNDDCKQLVMALLPCDHTANIPCRIASSPSQLKRFRCWNPCNTILDCEHQCAGTCDTCHSGRLHMRCQQKCERSLICSHVCKEPCAVNCPPCERECETRCIHSRCKKRCGEVCAPCKEPCAYKCKHLKCTRLCSEPCNRDPCNEPCDKKLKCGHTCIGFCCEPCPRECRICDKRIVQEILFGTEDEPDARFVFLPDCKHIIEVTALDKYVNDSFNNSQKDTAIRFPECPRCKQSIRRCMRYMPILNRVHSLIAQVKKKILGNKTEKELNEQRILLIKDFEKTENNLKEINLRENKNFFNRLYDSNIFLYDEILIRMKNILTFLNEIDKLLIDGRKALPKTVFANLLSLPLHHIIKYLFSKPQNRNFAEQQIKDIEAELIRFRRVIYYEALLKFINENSKCTLKSDEQNLLDSLKHLTKKVGRFTDIDKENFDSLIKTLEHLYNLPGLGITENERVAIVAALNLKKGHWYVCPKGHPYVITECGGANQESLCPECREKIGGQKHQLLPTNRHFDLMDNSQYAAWSDEANLNFIPQNI